MRKSYYITSILFSFPISTQNPSILLVFLSTVPFCSFFLTARCDGDGGIVRWKRPGGSARVWRSKIDNRSTGFSISEWSVRCSSVGFQLELATFGASPHALGNILPRF
ncbi:hypothetical protein DL93DRAFT_1087332 [Clavulina sp. PMI_390]|nr:hypothetical protein DL93DRAFT_1087332 [Clavulina sp. PMI_390]